VTDSSESAAATAATATQSIGPGISIVLIGSTSSTAPCAASSGRCRFSTAATAATLINCRSSDCAGSSYAPITVYCIRSVIAVLCGTAAATSSKARVRGFSSTTIELISVTTGNAILGCALGPASAVSAVAAYAAIYSSTAAAAAAICGNADSRCIATNTTASAVRCRRIVRSSRTNYYGICSSRNGICQRSIV
jgi:hypothetical protein